MVFSGKNIFHLLRNFTSVKSLMILLSGISTLLQGFTIVSWLLLLCLSIPSLPWLAPVKLQFWNSGQVMEVGVCSLQTRNGRHHTQEPDRSTDFKKMSFFVPQLSKGTSQHCQLTFSSTGSQGWPYCCCSIAKCVSNSATPWQRARCYPPLHTIILDFRLPFTLLWEWKEPPPAPSETLNSLSLHE